MPKPGARAGCPRDVPGSLASVGGGVAACVLRAPAHCSGGGFWAAVSPPVTSTPWLQPQRSGQQRGGLGLARSAAPRIPGTGRDVESSLPEISDGNGKAPGHGGMLSPLLPLHGVLCPCSSFLSVAVPGWCLAAHPGCRDPAESQQVASCALTPAPGQARSPLPSRVPATPEGQKPNREFPVLGRSPRRGRVAGPPGDPGATKAGQPSGTQRGWGVIPLGMLSTSPAAGGGLGRDGAGDRDKGWGQRQPGGWT